MTAFVRRIARAPSLVTVALVAGCAGSPKAPAVPHNQGASADDAAAGTGQSGPVLLWCAAPGGEMCGRASRDLRLRHTPADALPPELFEPEARWRDLADDCIDDGLADLLGVLGRALGVPPDGWVDQTGATSLDRLDVVVHGGGCTNRTAEGVPDVKVQLVESRDRVIAFVRVWELGSVGP